MAQRKQIPSLMIGGPRLFDQPTMILWLIKKKPRLAVAARKQLKAAKAQEQTALGAILACFINFLFRLGKCCDLLSSDDDSLRAWFALQIPSNGKELPVAIVFAILTQASFQSRLTVNFAVNRCRVHLSCG